MQFARGRDGGFMQYAIKFFSDAEDFRLQARHYENPLVRETLPQLYQADANADGGLQTESGYQFPPFMVFERGASLAECDPRLLLWRCRRRLVKFLRVAKCAGRLLRAFPDSSLCASSAPSPPGRTAKQLQSSAPEATSSSTARAALQHCCAAHSVLYRHLSSAHP